MQFVLVRVLSDFLQADTDEDVEAEKSLAIAEASVWAR
jgi:hypothetical protein